MDILKEQVAEIIGCSSRYVGQLETNKINIYLVKS